MSAPTICGDRILRLGTYLRLTRDFLRTHLPRPGTPEEPDPADEPAVRGLATDREDRCEQDRAREEQHQQDLQ
ncbi:MAG: hypothetical protein Q8M74_02485, partial [Chloroflexota bacterium]|nr:hypothetical protein [Chloroflexota bacterium]